MKQPDLGNKVSELRISMGLTQSELAEKCKLSLRTIQRIETAKVEPRSYTVKVIFSILNYPIYDSSKNKSVLRINLLYIQKLWFVRLFEKSLILFDFKTNTMKKLSYLSGLLLVSALLLVIFSIPAESKAQSEIYKRYYLSVNETDLSFVKKDKIVLYKTQQKKEFPRVEFYTDSKFCYFYNIKTDTVAIANKETGLYVTKVIENADKISGKYGMLIVQDSKESLRIVSLKIILKNEETIQYDIKEEDIGLVLTRK